MMHITAIGMVSPVGLDAESSCAAMRAGISGFAELPGKGDGAEAIVGAAVPDLDAGLDGEDRLIELLARAVAECVDGYGPGELSKVPLFVGLAEPQRPGGGAALADRIVPEVERRLGARFLGSLSRAFAGGRTAGFEALRRAKQAMRSEGLARCLVCGVDSYLNAVSLDWLAENWRLKNEENSDGAIPGEAAAAVMVQAQPDPSRNSQARVIGLGFGAERATVLSEEPLLGLGLAEASSAALREAGIPMHEIGFRISDVTGESYGFREQALVLGRLLRVHRKDRYPLWHCAENIGDTGAAAAVVELVVAARAFRKGYAPGAIAMCFAGGDWGTRAVALVAAPSHAAPEAAA